MHDETESVKTTRNSRKLWCSRIDTHGIGLRYLKKWLEASPALRVIHSREVMIHHLLGTYLMLRFWGQPEVV